MRILMGASEVLDALDPACAPVEPRRLSNSAAQRPFSTMPGTCPHALFHFGASDWEEGISRNVRIQEPGKFGQEKRSGREGIKQPGPEVVTACR